MLVSVVIPTRDRPKAVLNAVESVFASQYSGQFEVFVIDQSSDDAAGSALVDTFGGRPNFRYHLNQKPGVGAASSRNIGIALSNGNIVAIIDDDVTVNPDWMANLASEFASDPELQFICGKLTAPPFDRNEGYTPAFGAPANLSNFEMPIEAAGANFSMRRELFDKVGAYDEFCGPGSRLGASDDGDLTWRIMRSGAKWKACAHVEVVHTFGFRNMKDGVSLLSRYQRGLGGNFGRFTRRGDLLATLFFLKWQISDIFNALLMALKGQRPGGLGWVRDRMIGFCRGLALPVGNGFVDGLQLRRIRQELLGGVQTNRRSDTSSKENAPPVAPSQLIPNRTRKVGSAQRRQPLRTSGRRIPVNSHRVNRESD